MTPPPAYRPNDDFKKQKFCGESRCAGQAGGGADCAYLEKIAPWFYGELPSKESGEISAHIKECRICGDSLNALKKSGEYLEKQEIEPPGRIVNEILLMAKTAVSVSDFADSLIYVFSSWKRALAALSFAALIFAFFIKTESRTGFKWNSDLDSSIENLEYSMYEEQQSFLGDYMEESEDFESESQDETKVNNGRML